MPGLVRVAFVMVTAAAVSGCIVTGRLEPSGRARLEVRYRLVSVAHFEQSKVRFQSGDVRLARADMTADKWATFELDVADARKLSTAPAFAGVDVAVTDAPDGARTLTVATLPSPGELPAPYVKYLGDVFRLALELPGDVVRSNATSVAGRTASWVRPLGGKHDGFDFSVTFTPAASRDG